ncbi:extracellular solute-binding protein [Cohnella sp. GbtcB17]|uniref:extracellular solute-binding protein n=1 Tax=Cohnella sp. GbtcB17 TaxID=2824762 RepID=UPI001C3080E8|nr:extracellular solute-binding protein [Cohnella sp. GbtcB17]
MMKKSNRSLSMASLAILLFALAACGNDDNSGAATPAATTLSATGSEAPASSEAAADPMGKYDPPIEVTAVRSVLSTFKFENGDTIENNGWTKLYEKELGIKLKYLWAVDASQYDQKLNVMMTTGKLPDIMPVSGSKLKQLYDAGQLEDLTGVLEKYGSEKTKELLNKDGGQALSSATFKGQLVGLPLNPGSTDTASLLWIRADWLKKLNLAEPKTMDDVLKIAEAFAKRDPAGNGKNDTYGLGLSKDLYGLFAGMEGFFNGFHAYPTSWVKDTSGKLAYGSIQPEMKPALVKLQELYKNGGIDVEFGVKSADQLIQDVNSGKLGMLYGAHYMPLLFQEGKNNNPDMDLRPYRLPSFDDQPAAPQTSFSVTEYYVVRKGAEHPEAAVKLLNAFNTVWPKEQYPSEEIGVNGSIEKWQYALLRGTNPTANLDSYKRLKEALEKKDDSVLDHTTGQPFIYKTINEYQAGDKAGWGYALVFGPGGSQELLAAYNANNGFKPTEFQSTPTEVMSQKLATLNKLELETLTKIIMGSAPVDSFDEFVANWKKLGGDVITDEVANWSASKQ